LLGKHMGLHALIVNTLNLMLDKGRISLLVDFVDQYRSLSDRHSGRIRAHCRTAAELNSKQLEALKSKLRKLTGASVVELEIQTDPQLLAGFIVNVGGMIIDGSLNGRLNRLGQNLLQASQGN
jgi:F-type H+-transporting ATPase subunit delta